MSRGLTPIQKRSIAEKFLLWLKDNNISWWDKTYLLLREASEELEEEVFNLWKAFDLLIILGRIERNNPNGQKGCRVVSHTLLTEPVPNDAVICNRQNCPIIKNIDGLLK